jgi:lactoylglutathione lyase
MSNPTRFSGVFPIGNTDPLRLPVKDVGPAIAFYVSVLGFSLAEREGNGAILTRGDAQIRLEQNELDPEQASVYFEVESVDDLHAELKAKLIEPTDIMLNKHGENEYRVFFAKEPYGVCFCFGRKL